MVVWFNPHPTPTDVGLLLALVGKLFLDIAETMPPPPEHCGFWCRWSYDFIQRLAANAHKVGTTRQ